ncbi:hypothetical protein FE257_002574 [Aspergillus nanangensis]|uniref:Ankyrin repeat protein n=1 Tax=Aspergillus nanangensis TaxID=2582783 RepID=A0AAD4GY21_ASPNN|nr:hypothetical protein FE257_002574 [Aspergillus nanangensis]
MDPVSAFGVVSGAFQVVHLITQTAAGLSALREKYTHADLTIRSLIGELTTVKSAITQLDDWARYNTRASAEYCDYDDDLNVALDGCRVVMDVLSEEVAILTRGASGSNGSFGLSTRLKVVWNEDVMRGHQERLRSQVLALQLLLQACQCRSSSEQIDLLRRVENRRIIQKVADDTATLRTSSTYAASSHADTLSIGRQQPSIAGTEFDFDRAVVASVPYRRALQHPRPKPETQSVISSGDHSRTTDEGYGSGFLSNGPRVSQADSSTLSIRPPDIVGNIHSKSVTYRPTPLQPNQSPMRRWKSDSTSSSLPSRSSGSKREKFRSAIRQLSISSSTTSSSQYSLPYPADGLALERRVSRRSFNTSIDLNSREGSSAPLIVKTAQSGSRDDVERLLEGGHDIEARHINSRRNALLVASHCGNEAVVGLLIQNNARMNVTDVSGSTALHLAASRGHCDVLKLLIFNVDLEAKTTNGRTALWLAADQGQLDAMRFLIAAQAKVNARADNQMTPLHAAAKLGNPAGVGILISSGADIEAKDGIMMGALHYACEAGHLDAVELLLNNKANINVRGSDCRTPLICAAATGQVHITRLLLKKKASTQDVDDNSMTALHWAVSNGHTEVVDILSQRKGSLTAKDNAGRTALHLAVIESQFAVVELLLRRSPLVETRCASGKAALHYACVTNNIEISRLLLISGANIEAQDESRQRPVHFAAASGSMALLNLLCDKGASLEARDIMGDRALATACRHGRAAAVQNLLDRGCPLSLLDETRTQEDSLLCLASMGGHLPVVSILLERGASVLKRDERGWRPFYHAIHHGHPAVLRLLLSRDSARSADEEPDLLQFLENFGFSPSADITEEKKGEVRSMLGKKSRFPIGTIAARPSRSTPLMQEWELRQTRPASTVAPSNFQYTPEATPAQQTPVLVPTNGPQELPGTLEQGLPPSRSHTPERMHGGFRGTDVVDTTAPIRDGSTSAWTGQQIAMPQAQRPKLVDSSGENALPSTVFQLLEEWSQRSSVVSPVSMIHGQQSVVPGPVNAGQRVPAVVVRPEDEMSDSGSISSVYTAPEEAS